MGLRIWMAPFCVVCWRFALAWACCPFVSGHASIAWPSGGVGLHIWTALFVVLLLVSPAVCPFVLGCASMAGLSIGVVCVVVSLSLFARPSWAGYANNRVRMIFHKKH